MRVIAQRMPYAPSTGGASDEAGWLSILDRQIKARLDDSFAIGVSNTFAELNEVYRECSVAGWDGYAARPVSVISYLYAKNLIEALPLGTVQPSIGADPDGQITMEWHRAPRRTLSLSIDSDGCFHYAALIGDRAVYGTEPLVEESVPALLRLIDKVMAG